MELASPLPFIHYHSLHKFKGIRSAKELQGFSNELNEMLLEVVCQSVKDDLCRDR